MKAWLVGVALLGAVAAALAQEGGRGADARAMQADDAANPAFLWVKRGAALWDE
ncbi:MAG: sulfur oxidation c-type cytochrome SoxA, partial [Alphaproteobacteria bacterium]|nr:sulfur oxidation c-type cytochrome SoxA [Alphaproteobacteria bacterium]